MSAGGRRAEHARSGLTPAAELQRALLPAALPVLPRVRIAARYQAAARGEQAGGDWFDALALTDGSVALVVGDVVGQDVAAVAAMGQLRAVVTHLLAAEAAVEDALRQADAYAARTPALRWATLAVAVLDPADGGLRYITCGNPPPLIAAAGRGTRMLPVTGSGPLGTGSRLQFGTAAMRPGDLLLLYSNGLIQRPPMAVAESMADLCEAAAAAAGQGPRADASRAGDAPDRAAVPSGRADRLCEHAIASMSRLGYADDATALAAEFLAEPPPGLYLELPAVADSVLRVRRAFAAWLGLVDAAAIDANDLVLAVVETVTNAVEHAYPDGRPGVVELSGALGADGTLECKVADHGRWQAPDPVAGYRGHGLMVASEVVDDLRVSHATPPLGSAPGAGGTVVTFRRGLRRPAAVGADGDSARIAQRPAYRLDLAGAGRSPRARVSGPVDGNTADRMARQLLTACRGGTLPITLDLTGITYLASSGVRAIYQVRDRLAAHDQDLTILAAAGSSAQVLLDLASLPHVSA